MTFDDLRRFARRSCSETEAALREQLPDTPLEVISGVYIEHGQNREFQAQYGALNLNLISWKVFAASGEALVKASIHQAFRGHVEAFDGASPNSHDDPWLWLTNSEALSEVWRTTRTWKTLPFFLEGNLVHTSAELHIVEGHTRLRCLRNAIRLGLIPQEYRHHIWLGSRA